METFLPALHAVFPFSLTGALIVVTFLYLTGVRAHEFRDERYRRIHRTNNPAELPYSARPFLATKAEARFYAALRDAVEPGLKVCPKVRLADVIHCSDDEWSNGYGPPIASKHLDFTLVNPHSLRVACCIELDDASHRRPDRRERDRFVDAALAAAGVPLIRYRVSRSYSAAPIQRRVYATLRQAPASIRRQTSRAA